MVQFFLPLSQLRWPFFLGRGHLLPAAFVLYHVPRGLSPERSFFQSALLTSRTFSTVSTQVHLFFRLLRVHVFVNLERLLASGDISRRQALACLCPNTVIWLIIEAS